MEHKTVREIVGELWAEVGTRQQSDPQSVLATVSVEQAESLYEVVLGVLARHAGKQLLNDEDLPVPPLGQ
jgi:hypothetical protein